MIVEGGVLIEGVGADEVWELLRDAQTGIRPSCFASVVSTQRLASNGPGPVAEAAEPVGDSIVHNMATLCRWRAALFSGVLRMVTKVTVEDAKKKLTFELQEKAGPFERYSGVWTIEESPGVSTSTASSSAGSSSSSASGPGPRCQLPAPSPPVSIGAVARFSTNAQLNGGGFIGRAFAGVMRSQMTGTVEGMLGELKEVSSRAAGIPSTCLALLLRALASVCLDYLSGHCASPRHPCAHAIGPETLPFSRPPVPAPCRPL